MINIYLKVYENNSHTINRIVNIPDDATGPDGDSGEKFTSVSPEEYQDFLDKYTISKFDKEKGNIDFEPLRPFIGQSIHLLYYKENESELNTYRCLNKRLERIKMLDGNKCIVLSPPILKPLKKEGE